MTARYNPHSLQKQARKWPVSFSNDEFAEDLRFRIRQLNGNDLPQPIGFSCDSLPVSTDLIDEYGCDCARIAYLEAQNQNVSTVLLESAFKWLAKLFDNFSRPGCQKFRSDIWFEMILQAGDHILQRNHFHNGLACIRKAAKISPPSADLDEKQKKLVFSCLYPFIPIFAQALAENHLGSARIFNLAKLFDCFPELIKVRYSIENGGGHWAVFSRKKFNNSPLQSLLEIKWVGLACSGKSPGLQETDEGFVICMN
ncbi:MAG: hypothetical protein PWR01_2161 [Clostridiales bacterium]|nr:hypothetical protein [Clostridiales bacterium]MDN5281088.1 hypothetical protein [Candidatus Ozemobacter sp.]